LHCRDVCSSRPAELLHALSYFFLYFASPVVSTTEKKRKREKEKFPLIDSSLQPMPRFVFFVIYYPGNCLIIIIIIIIIINIEAPIVITVELNGSRKKCKKPFLARGRLNSVEENLFLLPAFVPSVEIVKTNATCNSRLIVLRNIMLSGLIFISRGTYRDINVRRYLVDHLSATRLIHRNTRASGNELSSQLFSLEITIII